MTSLNSPAAIDRRDALIALFIALFGLAIYTRVLAPDVLYSDSGEFQTLAYTWGMSHPTGYPVYLVLARLVGFIPMGTLAWRISWFSAIAAGVTLGGLYLVTRHLTGRGGAMIASLALLMSYTFWSQAIIAEVYTPATALIVIVMLALQVWRKQPLRCRWLLFVVGFILGMGPGIHLFLLLIVPSVGLFVLWGVVAGSQEEQRHWQHLARLAAGALSGAVVFILLFAMMDARPTPTSFFATVLSPSRDAWGLQESDLDTMPERLWLSVSGYQWRDAMLRRDVEYGEVLSIFFDDYLPREYARPAWALAILGAFVVLIFHTRQFALIGSALIVAFVAGLVYHPGDKYIFYLPVYVFMAIFIGAGAGSIILWITRLIPAVVPRAIPAMILTAIIGAICIAPFINMRWKAIQSGRAIFITEDYVFPVNRLSAPRRAAECALLKVAEPDALLVLDWQALYSIYYVAHVEQGRTGIMIYEAIPHGTQVVTENLQAKIADYLRSGGAVYVNNDHPPLGEIYTLTPVSGSCVGYDLFTLSPRGG
jgi:hypothetical protein